MKCVMNGCDNDLIQDLTLGGTELCPDCTAQIHSRYHTERLKKTADDLEGNLQRFVRGVYGPRVKPSAA